MTVAATRSNAGKSKLWKPPIVGIVTFFLMLFAIALSHALMVLIEHNLGRENTYIASIFMGAAASNRLKDTTHKLADGQFQVLSAEHVFNDYLHSTAHKIAIPEPAGELEPSAQSTRTA